MGCVRRERNPFGAAAGAAFCFCGEWKLGSGDGKDRSSALIELSVCASERGVWIAKWPAVAIVAGDAPKLWLTVVDFREVVGSRD